jgi:hypothetical protein
VAVLDWLQQLLGGGDPEAAGAAQASTAMQPMTQPWFDKVLSGEMARQGIQDVNDAFASRDPVALAGSFGPSPLGIRAWHASPYDFNKFDISKVGTGQGAASYGHGIYAAENPRVSGPGGSYDLEFTAKNLGKYDLNQGEQEVLRVLRAGGSDMDALGSLARGGGYTFEQAHDVLNRVKAAKARLYDVDINADPNALLNLDKPMSEQSELVRQALERAGAAPSLLTSNRAPAVEYVRRAGENPLYAADVFNRGVGELPLTPADVSTRLREAGIPGSQYLDEGSRGLGDPAKIQQQIDLATRFANDKDLLPSDRANWARQLAEWQQDLVRASQPRSSNYVMFDDKLMSIYRKLGLLPPLAAGGLLAAPGQGEAAQP